MKFPNFSGLTSNFSGGVNNTGGIVVVPPPSFTDYFEFIDGWPDTIADFNYYLTYTFTPTNVEDESFELAEGWT